MANTHEISADIIAEMRRRSDEAYKGSFNYPECQEHQIEYDEASEWADRLEAAIKRERGDCAKLREALKRIVAASIVAKNANAPEWILQRMADIFAMATTALSASPRNCDVGTAEEQTERFKAFCQSNMQFYRDMFGHDDEGRLDGWDCREDCPVGRMIDSGTAVADRCQLAWAQMPYVKKEGGNDAD